MPPYRAPWPHALHPWQVVGAHFSGKAAARSDMDVPGLDVGCSPHMQAAARLGLDVGRTPTEAGLPKASLGQGSERPWQDLVGHFSHLCVDMIPWQEKCRLVEQDCVPAPDPPCSDNY